MSRRYPLKRVRPNNENQSSILKSNGRFNKKFCREPSEDSAFVDTEKSSDERAFDLFQKEYFSQLRIYFKNRSVASQLLEYIWTNMAEQSKVAFVKKILKEQGLPDISNSSFNDENDCQSIKSSDESISHLSTLNSHHKYSRSFIHDLLTYMKYSIPPRSDDLNLSSKKALPLRRSSRIRRASMKCVCSTCLTSGGIEEHSFTSDDIHNKVFRELIEYYHQLDDQYVQGVNSLSLLNNNEIEIKSNEVEDNQVDQSDIIEKDVETEVPLVPIVSDEYSFSSTDLLANNSNEKSVQTLPDYSSVNEHPTRRTFVILTELDEPFFGPYPIEFTITI